MDLISPYQRPRVIAFKFKNEKDLETLCDDLSSLMLTQWLKKDNYFHGDYLALKKSDTQTIFRIFIGNENYLFDMINRNSINEEYWQREIDGFKHVLEICGGRDITAACHYY